MKNKAIKLSTSVENNMIDIINIIEKIYEVKMIELKLKTDKIDSNTAEIRDQIFQVQNILRNEMERCSQSIEFLFNNDKYTGKQCLKNYIVEFNLVEAKPKKRYAYYDIERIIIDNYEFCKNTKIRKAISNMKKKNKKYSKLSNNYTKKTNVKKLLANS